MEITPTFPFRKAVVTFGISAYVYLIVVMLMLYRFLSTVHDPLSFEDFSSREFWGMVLKDLLLLLFFISLHIVAASDYIKRIFARKSYLEVIHRSFFVIVTAWALTFVKVLWNPLPHTFLWDVTNNGIAVCLLSIGYHFGWVLSFIQTFTFDHAELVGLSQVFKYFSSQPYDILSSKSIEKQIFYSRMRHPLFLGPLFILFMTPRLTLDRLIIIIVLFVFHFVHSRLEKQDIDFLHTRLENNYHEIQTQLKDE